MARGNVWIAVAGFLTNSKGEVLVVKKKYSGLKGMWSIPAGFVQEGETLDEAAVREVKEETGICAVVTGVIGIRSGVIKHTISDNMVIFSLALEDESQTIEVQESELFDVKWKTPDELLQDDMTSVMVVEMLRSPQHIQHLQPIENINPGDQFQYSTYKLFL